MDYYVDLKSLGDEQLDRELKEKMSDDEYKTMKSDEVRSSLVNDMFVGPNEGQDIPQNEDFKDLTNRWGNSVHNPDENVLTLGLDYYQSVKAPHCLWGCYSPWHLVCALDEVLAECHRNKTFQHIEEKVEDGQIPIILVGPLTKHYSPFVTQFVDHCNVKQRYKGMKMKLVSEYVKNTGTRDVGDRSSGLQQVLKSVVNSGIISEFRNMEDVKREIMEPVRKSKGMKIFGSKSDGKEKGKGKGKESKKKSGGKSKGIGASVKKKLFG